MATLYKITMTQAEYTAYIATPTNTIPSNYEIFISDAAAGTPNLYTGTGTNTPVSGSVGGSSGGGTVFEDWTANTAYAIGDKVIATVTVGAIGAGARLRRNTAGTSGATFNSTEAAKWTELVIDDDVVPKTDIVDNLTTSDATKVLSAKQGKDLQDTKSATTHNHDTAYTAIAHGTNTSNPHSVTATQVGLGNASNTSDANKPVSTAQQTAIDLKANLASPTFTGTVAGITKSMVGLTNVDNTADTAKPVSTTQQTALDLKVDKVTGKGLSTNDFTTAEQAKLSGIAIGATANSTDAQLRDRSTHTGSQAQSTVTNLITDLAAKEATANKGVANGYAPLGADLLVPAIHLPTFATSLRLMTPTDILEDAQRATFLDASALNAGAVSAWGTFSQGIAGYQPVAETVATLGGRMAVKFDGTDDHMSSAHINLGVSYGIFAVIRTGATISINNHIVSAQYPNSVEYAFAAGTNFEGGTSGGPGMGIGHYNGAWRGIEGAAAAANTTYILLGQYTDGGTGFSFAVNGGVAVTNVTNSAPTVADSNTIWLGRRWDGAIDSTTVFNGHLATLIMKIGAFTATERAQLEGWAAWYYGIVASLPAGHTYKNAPPLITN